MGEAALISLGYVLQMIQWICLGAVLYFYILGFIGLCKPKSVSPATPTTRFAILIPAHNEEKVLPLLLESLNGQRYPKELIRVYVVADNCTDGTAMVAKALGAKVLERSSPIRGKGHALKFGLDYVLHTGCDAICVFDADNLVDPDFLQVMNDHLVRGAQAIQGRVETKNPFDSWVSASYAISFWVSNRVWQLARARVGLSSILCGTGMCFRKDLLRFTGWPAMSLTEDLEYSMILISKGLNVVWAHDAVVYDEKPATFWTSWRQRLRWLMGKWQVLFAMGPGLFTDALLERNWRKMDGVLVLLQPALVLLTPLSGLAGLVSSANLDMSQDIVRYLKWKNMVLSVLPYVLPALVMYLERVPLRAYIYLPMYTFFCVTWIPIAMAGFVLHRRRDWYRTPHKRAITLEQCSRLYYLHHG